MYSQPAPSVLDFAFTQAPYAQPAANALDIDFAASTVNLVYSIVPGVIKDVSMSWRPQPGARQSAISMVYQQASEASITRELNANQAGAILNSQIASPFGKAEEVGFARGAAWGSPGVKNRSIESPHKDAQKNDIDARVAGWALAGQHLDPKLAAPFLVQTPWKDRHLGVLFFSSDLYGPIWHRQENTPRPIARVQEGLADIGFLVIRKSRDSLLLELAPAFENNPIQPRDQAWTARHQDAPPKDIHKTLPWGPSGARDTTLRFVANNYTGPIDDGKSLLIPTLRFYVVANSAQIVRVSDGRDIAATSVNLAIGSDSFTWSFTASLAGKDAKALVEGPEGEPVEVDITINGVTWRILVDGWDETELWSRGTVTVRGRSRAAFLAAPYAPTRDYSETSGLLAQQLAAQELPSGWDMDWNMVNWFVPPGAWQYQGLSPVEAIAKIAASAGGYIQAHPTDDTLIVNQHYPDAPWNLDTFTPDYQLPRSVIVQRSSRKVPGQRINGVYVMGGGVAPYHAQVIRRYSSGLSVGQTIVDPLITASEPAEVRGIAVIASSLRQARETHELPLSAALGGLIEVGSLLEVGVDTGTGFVGGWRGLVRGVSVSAGAGRSGNGGTFLSVRQRLEIERSFDEGDL